MILRQSVASGEAVPIGEIPESDGGAITCDIGSPAKVTIARETNTQRLRLSVFSYYTA
jgi:hypothetical protein